jgi:hypothetical protein
MKSPLHHGAAEIPAPSKRPLTPAAERLREHIRAIWDQPFVSRQPSPAEILEADEFFAACDRRRARNWRGKN